MEPPAAQRNETLRALRLVCKIMYLLCGTNFWFQDFNYPKRFMKLYESVSKFIDVFLPLYVLSEWLALHTQTHLNEQQTGDMYIFANSHLIFIVVYDSIMYYKQELRKLIYTLGVELQEVFNDPAAGKQAVRKGGWFLLVLASICLLLIVSNGINGGIQALTTNATFVTIIPVWPDVEDRRAVAGVARILHYCVWWIFGTRIITNNLIILTVFTGLAYQFANLCKYFESLNSIFDGTGSQADKEKQFEDAFKVGIKMHSTTLWCAQQVQAVGSIAFSAQVILNNSALVLLLLRVVQTERTFIALMPVIFMALSLMIFSGIFMCNAGDITIEASKLPTAVFSSGWHNCQRESSVRVRKMVTIAIAQAQQRVVIKGLGWLELSYETFVQESFFKEPTVRAETRSAANCCHWGRARRSARCARADSTGIVKLSYSFFSVIY